MENYLIHYGVLGMKWGVRRYQNEDGTLTRAGQKRYTKIERQKAKAAKSIKRYGNKASAIRKETKIANGKKRVFELLGAIGGTAVGLSTIGAAASAGGALLGVGAGFGISAATIVTSKAFINKNLDKKLSYILDSEIVDGDK